MMETKTIAFLGVLGVSFVMAIGSIIWTALLYRAYSADTLRVNNLIVKGRVTHNAQTALEFYAQTVVGGTLFANSSDQSVEIVQINADSANATSLTLSALLKVNSLEADELFVEQNIIQKGNIPSLTTQVPMTIDSVNATFASFDMVSQETSNITAESLTAGSVVAQNLAFTELKAQQAAFVDVTVGAATTVYATCESTGTADIPLLRVSNGAATFAQQANIEILREIQANTDLNVTFGGTARFSELTATRDATFYNNSEIGTLNVGDELTLNNTNFVDVKINNLNVDQLSARTITEDGSAVFSVSNLTTEEATIEALSAPSAAFSFPITGSATVAAININDQLKLAQNTLTIAQNTTITSNSLAPLQTSALTSTNGVFEFEHLNATGLLSTAQGAQIENSSANALSCANVTTSAANLGGIGSLDVTGALQAGSFVNDAANFIALKNDKPWIEASAGEAAVVAFCSQATSSQGQCIWN